MHASTHRGGVGTPLEGTYFQAKLGNARCVQSLDDSLNSAIHITYRISLRSSSLREPRYPSTGVVLRGLWGCGRPTTAKSGRRLPAHVGWGGGGHRATTRDARRTPSRTTRALTRSAACPRAPNPNLLRRGRAGGGTRRPTPKGDRRRPESQSSHGVRNGYR